MPARCGRFIFWTWLLLSAVPPARAATEDEYRHFVRPWLEEHCHACHSHRAGKMKGDLALDSFAALRAGGEHGPAVVPGQPEQSLLLEVLRRPGDDRMPPPKEGPAASAEVLARLEAWIRAGAPAPADDSALAHAPPRREKISAEDRAWWAFQSPQAVAPPEIALPADANPVDAFIRDRLAREGLTPAPPANRATLIRRVTFDLWGLPPSPAEVDAFLADPDPDSVAYARLVDRLLADRRYGERWARHWLDLVRYADSDGYRIDDLRPTAHLYRDYVIRSFNADKPYDRFVREQLAGDELYPGDPDALIATGTLRHWIYEYNSRDAETQWDLILTDITDTTGDVFFGLGFQCARCHDHKFDPLLQKDYFRLRAFFAALLPREDLPAATEAERAAHAAARAEWAFATSEIRKVIDSLELPFRRDAEREAVGKFPPEVQAMIRKPESERTPYEHQVAQLAWRQVEYEWYRLERRIKDPLKEDYLARKRDLAAFDALKPADLPLPLAAVDLGPVAAPTVISPKRPEPIDPAWPEVLGLPPPEIQPLPGSTGRRAALARWLTEPDNPFTARVMVNRMWQQLFGRGLAANASDFGKLGERPSHPELLDWLAVRFRQDGYRLKSLHRLLVTSATYRQSAHHPDPEAARIKDPENRLRWRAPVRRLEAEQIRDALFAASGELKEHLGGPGQGFQEPFRSIYTTIKRNTRDPLLNVFDAPYWFSSASARDTTTTPVQSLLLINNSFLLQRARALAARAMAGGETNESAWVTAAYRHTFGRAPQAEELEAARAFLAEQARRIDPEQAASAQAAFLSGKIPYRDGQAAEIRPQGPQQRFRADLQGSIPGGDFTVEAYAVVRSIYTNANVRTIAGVGTVPRAPGWAFGVTGQRSRRKPQTLVMHLYGRHQDGQVAEEAVFSDHHIELNKPYYLGAAVRLATTNTPGEVAFYLKDLANDDEPLLVARVPHRLVEGHFPDGQVILGGRRDSQSHHFDGLIDDIRITRAALDVGQVLYNSSAAHPETVAYWTFEAVPDVFQDASGHRHTLRGASASGKSAVDLRKQALVDFCHVLLNANEFLYVE
jgi:hypothetical protein